jgi:HEAT repeat protein
MLRILRPCPSLLQLGVSCGNVLPKAASIDQLVSLLQTGNTGEKVRATGALRELATIRSHASRIADAGAIGPLIGVLKTGETNAKTVASAALGNVASDAGGSPEFADVYAEAVAPLVELLRGADAGGREEAAGALWQLAEGGHSGAIAEAGAVPPPGPPLAQRRAAREAAGRGRAVAPVGAERHLRRYR